MMKVSECLTDLAENHCWDIVDGEVTILPIKEEE